MDTYVHHNVRASCEEGKLSECKKADKHEMLAASFVGHLDQNHSHKGYKVDERQRLQTCG